MSSELITAIQTHQGLFGLELSKEVLSKLDRFYALVQEHNPLLHLVGPCTADEFAVRHVLESLTMLEFLPEGARFADVGSGAGFPAIPCLIARGDLGGVLVESKEKKCAFLRDTVENLGIAERAAVINKQFAEFPRPNIEYVSCRALDRFTQHLSKLIKWAGDAGLLFFGGPALGEEMQRLGIAFERQLMPLSEQRYLFSVKGKKRI